MPANRASRRTLTLALASAVLATAFAACDESEQRAERAERASPAEPTPEPAASESADAACADEALAATKRLKVGLKTRLMEAMGEGPAAAVDVCHGEAEAIRARVAEETGVRIGRTSQKLRNPANAEAPEWAKAYLESPAREGGELRPRVTVEDGEARAVAPLVAGGLCLTCHGAAVPDEVQAILDEHYPNDEATGYAAGDLRGVVWAVKTCER